MCVLFFVLFFYRWSVESLWAFYEIFFFSFVFLLTFLFVKVCTSAKNSILIQQELSMESGIDPGQEYYTQDYYNYDHGLVWPTHITKKNKLYVHAFFVYPLLFYFLLGFWSQSYGAGPESGQNGRIVPGRASKLKKTSSKCEWSTVANPEKEKMKEVVCFCCAFLKEHLPCYQLQF